MHGKTVLKVLGVALTLWAVLLVVGVSIAHSSPAPIRTVEKLALQREVAYEQAAGKVEVQKVQCGRTRNPYLFLCAFIGTKVCAITYVHYNPRNPAYGKPYKVNFWHDAWPCTAPPPYGPPQFPGDTRKRKVGYKGPGA